VFVVNEVQSPNPFGKTSESEIAAFEETIGFKIPCGFRRYLLQFNGGDYAKTHFPMEKYDGEFENLRYFFSLNQGPEFRRLTKNWKLSDYDLRECESELARFLVIGEASCGAHILIDTDSGALLLYEPDHPEFPNAIALINHFETLSDSFTEFVESLVALCEIPIEPKTSFGMIDGLSKGHLAVSENLLKDSKINDAEARNRRKPVAIDEARVIEKANPYGAIKEQDIIDFEGLVGFSLPAEYKQFMLKYNSPRFATNLFHTAAEPDMRFRLNGLFPLKHGSENILLENNWNLLSLTGEGFEKTPEDYIAIGLAGGGTTVVLSTKSESVYLFDPRRGKNRHAVALVASLDIIEDSFNRFVNSLVSPDVDRA